MSFKTINVQYLKDYKLSLLYSDKVTRTVDFEDFLKNDKHNSVRKYLDLSFFKEFKLHNEKLIWGENWDIIFPTQDIYHENINCLKFIET